MKAQTFYYNSTKTVILKFIEQVFTGANVLETPPFSTYFAILSHQVAKKIFP